MSDGRLRLVRLCFSRLRPTDNLISLLRGTQRIIFLLIELIRVVVLTVDLQKNRQTSLSGCRKTVRHEYLTRCLFAWKMVSGMLPLISGPFPLHPVKPRKWEIIGVLASVVISEKRVNLPGDCRGKNKPGVFITACQSV